MLHRYLLPSWILNPLRIVLLLIIIDQFDRTDANRISMSESFDFFIESLDYVISSSVTIDSTSQRSFIYLFYDRNLFVF